MALHDITAEICCGCRACEQICPKHCISMEKDFEGFYIPNLDSQECIECGLCEKVCPIRTKPTENTIDNIYAMQLKDETELMKSSSGGAFRLIADFIIDNNGMVCSCAFDSSNKAVFRTATSKDDLDDFQGSKYVQSDTGNAYSVIRDYLKKGKTVFFSGAPCQCAALLNFLGVPFDNLYTADFLCHSLSKAVIVWTRMFTVHSGINQPYTWSFFAIVCLIIGTIVAWKHSKKISNFDKDGKLVVKGFYPVLDLSKFWSQVAFFTFCGLTIIMGYYGNTAFIYGVF